MGIRLVLLALAVGLLFLAFAVGVYAGISGNLEPSSPPGLTSSYTLEDIYNRLNTGAAGSQSPFTEPSSGPGTRTMHTLNEVMDKAPAADNTNGAVRGEVLTGKTYWGLRSDGAWGTQTGTGYPAPVPQTGQTVPYATGDDGELERGVAWPNPRFTDHGNGTVTDEQTGLTWPKNANCFGVRTWEDALRYANQLKSGECNLSDGSKAGDWRLPDRNELASVLDLGSWSPAIPSGHPFVGVQPGYYWTSTTHHHDPSYAWHVNVYAGHIHTSKKGSGLHVWPVRGGQ